MLHGPRHEAPENRAGREKRQPSIVPSTCCALHGGLKACPVPRPRQRAGWQRSKTSGPCPSMKVLSRRCKPQCRSMAWRKERFKLFDSFQVPARVINPAFFLHQVETNLHYCYEKQTLDNRHRPAALFHGMWQEGNCFRTNECRSG